MRESVHRPRHQAPGKNVYRHFGTPEKAEVKAPTVAVDPMMDENRKTSLAPKRSFSEIDELPPLKEAYVAPPSSAAI